MSLMDDLDKFLESDDFCVSKLKELGYDLDESSVHAILMDHFNVKSIKDLNDKSLGEEEIIKIVTLKHMLEN